MTRYSVQPRDWIIVRGYGLWTIGKNISKNLSGKHSQKLFGHAKQSATNVFKTASKRAIQKTAEATGDLIGNKIAHRITKVSEKIYNKIIQKQLQISMIKKYLKKDIYLQRRKTRNYRWTEIKIRKTKNYW